MTHDGHRQIKHRTVHDINLISEVIEFSIHKSEKKNILRNCSDSVLTVIDGTSRNLISVVRGFSIHQILVKEECIYKEIINNYFALIVFYSC